MLTTRPWTISLASTDGTAPVQGALASDLPGLVGPPSSQRSGPLPPESMAGGRAEPILAVALHDGHAVREEVAAHLALPPTERLREEDPFTGAWTSVAPTRIVVHRSRFEVDLNRPAERAIYGGPADAWGLDVWRGPLPSGVRQRSLDLHAAFYAELDGLLDELVRSEGGFVLLDLHSYNHRRAGPEAPAAPQADNPDVNVGTGTLDRGVWGALVDRFQRELSGHTIAGRPIDVRENIRFRGGYLARHVHERYPGVGCVLAIEVKKVFMDEWSSQPVPGALDDVHRALESTVAGLREELTTVTRKRGHALGTTLAP